MNNETQHKAVYMCAKGKFGQGFAIALDEQPTATQQTLAAGMIYDCEGRNRRVDGSMHPENRECPIDCPLRKVASGNLSE